MDYPENPKTRRDGHKTAKEKKEGKDRLGSGKGSRAAEANQSRNKKQPRK
jgi:ribosome assembly protein YihI (activator of Der GTPase)